MFAGQLRKMKNCWSVMGEYNYCKSHFELILHSCNFRTDFYLMPRIERSRFLLNIHGFMCNCEACENYYETFIEYRPTLKLSKSFSKNVKTLKRHLKTLKYCENMHPCYKTCRELDTVWLLMQELAFYATYGSYNN